MRLDPKFFNLFIAICAAITLVAIIFFTVRYSQKQVHDFRENMEAVQLDTLSFKSYTDPDSLRLSDLSGNPVVIQFWSTWSGKSQATNRFLNNYHQNNPNLQIIAAVVRDDESLIKEYILNHTFPFRFVEGTALYQTVFVPGIPSQILIKPNGELFDTHIGDDTSGLEHKLNLLLRNE